MPLGKPRVGKAMVVVASAAVLIPFISFWLLFHFGNERNMSEGDSAGVRWQKKGLFL